MSRSGYVPISSCNRSENNPYGVPPPRPAISAPALGRLVSRSSRTIGLRDDRTTPAHGRARTGLSCHVTRAHVA